MVPRILDGGRCRLVAAFLVGGVWNIQREFFRHPGAPGLCRHHHFAVTVLWPLDAVLAWVGPHWPNPILRRVLRFVAWAAVTLSFITAAAVSRSGSVRIIGISIGVLVIVALLLRFLRLIDWKPE
jgi:hypothetical protein